MNSSTARKRRSESSALAPFTQEQIADLDIKGPRPLVVSDADEVLVRFAEPLERFLSERDLYLDIVDYRLVGNIRRQSDHSPVDQDTVFGLIDDFFEKRVDHLPLVDGAVEALESLARHADVVILTNVPNAYRDRRIQAFQSLGLNFPVVANSGLKGGAVRVLADLAAGPVAFVDDIDRHIADVATTVPDSYRIHFVADPRLAAVCERAPHSHHRSDCWRRTSEAIEKFLEGATG
ncbi:MAG: hypothetical protein D6763_10780 [Alphaproteobacteria bacterium]|nr:MAG: hypothetical protein D6763_10780 [Alphaproteobacteria bacterium]